MKKKYSRKKGPVRSKKVSIDGINFASGLEKYMYLALKKAKIPAIYEGETLNYNPLSTYRLKATNARGTVKANIVIEEIKKSLTSNTPPTL